jgi:hypothetical protein
MEAPVISDADAAVVRAEVVALQAVVISVFRQLSASEPELARIFCKAFDEAETILSGVAVKMGLEAPAETTIGALRVVEELRRAVIRDDSICRHD